MFLKLYEGFSDPIGFKYRWAIFGFYWTVIDSKFGTVKYTDFETAAMTVGFFQDPYDYDASMIRGADFTTDNDKNNKLKKIYKEGGKKIQLFECSDNAGWHCSYCLRPVGIRKKLLDAPRSDWPRWGDDERKSSIPYIKELIKTGRYFDGKYLRGSTNNTLTEQKDSDMAPKYVLLHPEKFQYLLLNPYT